MFKYFLPRIALILSSVLFVLSCSTESTIEELDVDIQSENLIQSQLIEEEESTFINLDKVTKPENTSAQSGGGNCNHVVIINGYAYASCNSQLIISNLETGEIATQNMSIIDVAADEVRSLLFTYNGSTIRLFSLDNPMAPQEEDTASASFSIFTGFSAAGCTLAVSGGTSNTTVYRYSIDPYELVLTSSGIPAVDNVTGTPNVHVALTAPGEITAFYSQDIGAVANWAIQPAIFNGAAELQSTPQRTVLTPLPFTGSFNAPFAPTNFGVESEYLDDRLYVAHFAVPGIEVVDVATGNLLSPINLSFEPINVATDGSLLFVVGPDHSTVDIINPSSGATLDTLGSLQTPTGVAANATHIAVADQSLGLVIIER